MAHDTHPDPRRPVPCPAVRPRLCARGAGGTGVPGTRPGRDHGAVVGRGGARRHVAPGPGPGRRSAPDGPRPAGSGGAGR
ncbi:hypothetical protein GBO37_20280 [Paracoccus sp. 08]|nr:hypothetical protein [Paracoccus sp. 08]